MAGEMKLTQPEQLTTQQQIHQTRANQHRETASALLSVHGQLSGAWQGGGYEDIGQFLQTFAQHMSNLADWHEQIGANLVASQQNHEQNEALNTRNMS